MLRSSTTPAGSYLNRTSPWSWTARAPGSRAPKLRRVGSRTAGPPSADQPKGARMTPASKGMLLAATGDFPKAPAENSGDQARDLHIHCARSNSARRMKTCRRKRNDLPTQVSALRTRVCEAHRPAVGTGDCAGARLYLSCMYSQGGATGRMVAARQGASCRWRPPRRWCGLEEQSKSSAETLRPCL